MSTYNSSGGGGGAVASDVASLGVQQTGEPGSGADVAREDHQHPGSGSASLDLGTLDRYGIPGWWAASVGTSSPVNGRLYYILIYVPRAITYDRIGVNVASAQSGALGRLGIYTPSADGRTAGVLLLDAGQVDLSTTGVKQITISQALVAGYYFLTFVGDTTGTSLTGIGSSAVMPPVAGLTNALQAAPSGLISFTGSRAGDVAGGLPTPAPAIDNNFAGVSNAFVRLRES